MDRVARFSRALAIVAACLVGSVQGVGATTISFEAINLKDVASNQDLWMYKYFVSDATFQPDRGFTVFFDLGLYSDLSVSPKTPGTPDWDPLVIQPDRELGSDGFFDALALAKGASLANPFIVTFNWLGGAGSAPGVQRFEVYKDPLDIKVLETGLTRPVRSVPEPSTLLLSGLGLALASRLRRSRS